MTGIERLYKLIADIDVSADPELWDILRGGTEGDWDCEKNDDKTLCSTLAAIAVQIEREQGGRVSRMRVLAVVTDMERHVSGVEGMEDSPVARWARDLKKALDGRSSAAGAGIVHSDNSEVLQWVREHGGLDAMERRWECLSYYADPVPRSCMEKRLARLQRQIDESHAALRRRNQRIAVLASEINRAHNENRMEFMRRAGNYTAFADEVCKRLAPELRYIEGCTKDVMDAALEALDRRLMPEGCEWPRYESGEPVRIGDVVSDVEVRSVVFRDGGILLSDCTSVPGWGTWRSYKEPIKRPSVPASDGKALEVGQTVWDANGDELVVGALEDGGNTVTCRYADVGDGIPVHGMWSPSDLTHQRPALDVGGVPIREGDTVYNISNGTELVITSTELDEFDHVKAHQEKPTKARVSIHPLRLTHTKPEIDS